MSKYWQGYINRHGRHVKDGIKGPFVAFKDCGNYVECSRLRIERIEGVALLNSREIECVDVFNKVNGVLLIPHNLLQGLSLAAQQGIHGYNSNIKKVA